MGDRHLDPAVRHEGVLLFDVTDGNPNGDPDGSNRPRTDDETGHGLVTDVSIKRKIRDTIGFAAEAAGLPPGRFQIFVAAGHALATRGDESYTASGIKLDEKTLTDGQRAAAQGWLADRYVDIRLFGAVLSVGKTKALGQIRGPLQFGMARSIDPVAPVSHAITRVTQTRQEDIDSGKVGTFGAKWTVPYGLYRAEFHYSAPYGKRTGVTSEDLALLWKTMLGMFTANATATRPSMDVAGLWVFSHPDAFGVAPARRSLGRIRPELVDPAMPPRAYTDYRLHVGAAPAGVETATLANIWSDDDN